MIGTYELGMTVCPCGGQKRMSSPLELGLPAAVSCLM